MDSMRSLKGSLPSTSTTRRRQSSQPPELLLQAFKQAALSVTTLYKTAAADQADAYREGRQEVLEELLTFLDKENLGLQDGEGWRVRQWVTERAQGSYWNNNSNAESDEEHDDDKRARSSSPTLQRPSAMEDTEPSTQQEALQVPDPISRPGSAPPAPPMSPEVAKKANLSFSVPTAEFSFRSAHEPPTVIEMDVETPESTSPDPSVQSSIPTVQLNLISRQTRHHTTRSNGRQLGTVTALGHGAGIKRRVALGDFFDISGLSGKDGLGGGGGKRSRLS